MKIHLPVLCPSAKCEPGAILLGVVQEEGEVSLLVDRIAVNRAFVETARMGRPPEKRFRFANPCIQRGCRQWVDNRCSVIDAIIHDVGRSNPPPDVPRCSIQQQCRWYQQRGSDACAVCPQVITDLRDSDEGERYEGSDRGDRLSP